MFMCGRTTKHLAGDKNRSIIGLIGFRFILNSLKLFSVFYSFSSPKVFLETISNKVKISVLVSNFPKDLKAETSREESKPIPVRQLQFLDNLPKYLLTFTECAYNFWCAVLRKSIIICIFFHGLFSG